MKLNEFNLALGPTLKPVFSKSAYAAALDNKDNSRDLFYALIHISENYAILPRAYCYLKQHFQTVTGQYRSKFSEEYSPNNLGTLLKNTVSTHPYKLPDTALNECLAQYAPIYFTELSWLANISQTVTSQTPLVVDLMAVYSRLTEDDQSIANSRAIYSAHLLSSGIELPAVHTLAFAKQSDVGDEIFDFAAIQLALAQFPRVFFPEILGFTLSYCQALSLPEQFFPDCDDIKLPSFLTSRSDRRKHELPYFTAIIKAYLGEFKIQTDDLWRRIQAGFWLHQQQLEHCNQRIGTQLHTTLSPRQAVQKLLATLTPNAIGHHGKIRLGSKSIDDWFKEDPFKSANFLATLLHSPYIDRAKPENSRLLKLFEFNGPMFGVLDESGKTILKNWLLSELTPGLTQSKKNKSANYKVGLKSISSKPAAINGLFEVQQENSHVVQDNYAKLSNRELYFYLVNNDLFPEVLPISKHKVDRVLVWAKFFNRLPFRRYSHQAFESYIHSIYQHEVDTYKPLNKKPKLSRNAYVWGIEQFAPTILTDGSWLQGIHQLDYYSSHAIGTVLHKIYEDETGNGILEQNHPFIYQELLNSLNIKLPPIYSKDFIDHPGFIGSAFDIPVYLMAISKFPSALLPELLGLNMAIELSGLGKVYLRLSEELKFWGINSAIVDVHISIDNLSSGHSALAIKAIQAYLDEVSACYGEQIMQTHWRRIYAGYCSLQTVSNRFKFSLIGQYLLKRLCTNNNY
ncbi:iron-containing redox enzyme family protein [Methyloglobulus sp.]|uniref:iron-containing redox enzyme family protein n=1 Tax=Methyloglobulus sp. TaxID=2518622 RepID=UPI003988EEFF